MKPTILICEDDADQRQMLAFFLERRGYEVYQAADGKEGLEMARTVRPGLILLDVMMPEMDGRTVCHKLKSDSAMENIPVIICTAGIESGVDLSLREADGSLSKPWDWDHLLELVHRWLPQ